MAKKVLIIGGLGFIGYHISKVLTNTDFLVTIGHRSKSSKYDSIHKLIYIDLNLMSVQTINGLIQDFNYVIFCGGADDRKIPVGDVESFFYRENVIPCEKLVEASTKTNLEKIILLGSYFTHFDRLNPEWNLRAKHPYIKSRHQQLAETIELAKNQVKVSTIEIPYVFGSSSGKIPLWKPLINYIDKMPFVLYTKGGTNIMSVEQVAKAVLGVLKTEKYKPHWIVGSENVSWKELIQMISRALGKKRYVILLPNIMVKIFALLLKIYFKIRRKQMGLDPYHFVEVQTSNTFLDLRDSMQELNYDQEDMQQSINDTVRACQYFNNE